MEITLDPKEVLNFLVNCGKKWDDLSSVIGFLNIMILSEFLEDWKKKQNSKTLILNFEGIDILENVIIFRWFVMNMRTRCFTILESNVTY